jgi:secondary thiamine-phosphate synthase enzyme
MRSMYRKIIQVSTNGEGEIVDLSGRVRDAVTASGITEGMIHVFVTGSTVAVTTIEYETGVLQDLKRALSVLAPDTIPYAHDSAWGDGNGRSHVKASVIGPDLTIPVTSGAAMLGTWQQVVLLELDVRAQRNRTVVLTVWGE